MIDMTLSIDNIEIEISPETIKMFQAIEDRFQKALQSSPIPELDKILDRGAIVTVSFKRG